MNRETLLRQVAAETDEPLGIVEQIVDATLRAIVDALDRDEPVKIDGFGTYRMVTVEQKMEKRSTGETIVHPIFRRPEFRADRNWRKRINGGVKEVAE